MAVQKVVTYGHSALRAISKNITDFSNIRSLIDDLFDTMYEFDGIGLAANQIGINKRIFVVDISLNKPKTLDNPVPVTTFFKLPNIPI